MPFKYYFRQDLQDLQDISLEIRGISLVNLVNPVEAPTCDNVPPARF